MNINKKKKIDILIYDILMLLSIATVITFITGDLVWYSNVSRYMEKIYDKPMSIKADNEFSYKGKVYRIIFSTPEEKKDELYLQCFEEKFNGLVYKPTYGASQGGSKYIYGMTNHFLNNSANDSFFVVYGYNKELKANNFSVKKVDNGEWITQDISKQEYFLYIYTNIEYARIVFKDIHDNDLTNMFHGQ